MRGLGIWLLLAGGLTAQTLYDFGNPTSEEQLYIELINRARANPTAEGVRLAATTDPAILAAYSYFGVDLAMMQTEFSKLKAAPPLVPNALLTGIARNHSQWMLANNTQSHNQTNPSNTPFTRMTAAGYNYQTAGENVYASAQSVEHGHAGFEVDWGSGPGGMQTGRGHRANIHNASFREIGVGVISGRNNNVGPQLVTQDFGTQKSSPTFATGVAYYDLNQNQFYDIGEGIAGLAVNVSGASYYCTTAVGGGWVVPVPGANATRTVSFSGLAINQSVNLTIASAANSKADLRLTYLPPQITSGCGATAGEPHLLSFQAVGGATAYHCSAFSTLPAGDENCDTTARILTSTTGSYPVLSTTLKQQGSASFHLLNSTGNSQWLELDRAFLGGSAPVLSFYSLVRYASSSEAFKVQVRQDGANDWVTVYQQTGTNSPGENFFIQRTASLSSMAGKSFRIRFLLDYGFGGGYYPYEGDTLGWFIDDIRFSDVSETQILAEETISSTAWSFMPAIGLNMVRVAPMISGRKFPAATQGIQASAASIAVPTFESWVAGHEASNSLPPGTLADPAGDPDRDGRCNLLEYALGGSPLDPIDSSARLPVSQVTPSHFKLRYQIDTSLSDVSVTPQACAVLGVWKSPGEAGAPSGLADQLIATDGSIQTREASLPLTSAPRCFLRLRVNRP